MEIRTIKELLEVMLNNKQIFTHGLCAWAFNLFFKDIISLEELYVLKSYIKSNRPFNFNSLVGEAYFWKSGKLEPRIKWLNKHIKKNS